MNTEVVESPMTSPLTELERQLIKLGKCLTTYVRKRHPDQAHLTVMVEAILRERFGYTTEAWLAHQDCPEALASIRELVANLDSLQENALVESALVEAKEQALHFDSLCDDREAVGHP